MRAPVACLDRIKLCLYVLAYGIPDALIAWPVESCEAR